MSVHPSVRAMCPHGVRSSAARTHRPVMAHGPRARNLQLGQELAADSQLAQPLARQMQSFYRMKLEKAQAPVAHGLLSLKSGQDGKYECVDPEVGKMRITSHNVPLAETAQTTLGKLDAELTASLSDPDRKVVRTALEQVGNLGSVRSTQAIRDIAIFGDPEFQGLARAALLRLGDYSLWDRAIEFATQPVQNIEVRRVQFGVVEAVIDIRDPSMVPALNSLLASPLVSLRRGAAKALRGISDPSSARFLVRSLDDSDPDIQYDAVMALAALPGASPSNAPARDIFDQEPAKYLG